MLIYPYIDHISDYKPPSQAKNIQTARAELQKAYDGDEAIRGYHSWGNLGSSGYYRVIVYYGLGVGLIHINQFILSWAPGIRVLGSCLESHIPRVFNCSNIYDIICCLGLGI